jgi:short subunit dehydrogenase-like uncharacterized protein
MPYMTWMVYGANGYTGQLVAREAVARGERPVLAGRNPSVAALADSLGLEHRIFDLSAPDLSGVTAVAHCAGPFSATSRQMVDACIAAGVHYLDVTGEIDVFEAIHARSAEAAEAGVVLLPGAGFDVVPSDCLAGLLARALPSATSLKLAFTVGGGMSRGTLRTTIEGMGTGGRIRVGGSIVDAPMAHEKVTAFFLTGPRTAVSLPWGDVATAYHSTGIPNITTHMALPIAGGLISTGQRLMAPLMRLPFAQRLAKKLAGLITGPGERQRTGSHSDFWGEVRDDSGAVATVALKVPNAYSHTADAVVTIAQRIGDVKPGAHTPATAFGPDFVRELKDVTVGPVAVLS